MTETLRLTLQRDTDGTGELSAEADADGFSGIGSAWFNVTDIAAFGHSLSSTYPLLPDQNYEIKGGVLSTANPGTLSEIHLCVSFYPVGHLGKVGCRVHLATGRERGDAELSHTVTLELHTTYERLRQFGLSVSALADGKVNEASL